MVMFLRIMGGKQDSFPGNGLRVDTITGAQAESMAGIYRFSGIPDWRTFLYESFPGDMFTVSDITLIRLGTHYGEK